MKERFLREGRILAQLNDEHIVRIHHLGVADNRLLYLVMELLNGRSLRKLIEENSLHLSRAIGIIKQCCLALNSIHELGIVHRDIKPENIFLIAEGSADFVKVIDFGLVHIKGSLSDKKLTKTGFLIGSASYMSPEQCRGASLDSRSDLYSLALCFYELLAGTPPFSADSHIGVMYKHMNEPVPKLTNTCVKGFDPAINEFMAIALAKEPQKRFQNAMQMHEELEKLQELSANSQTSKTKQANLSGRKSWIPPILLAILLAVVLIVALNNGIIHSKLKAGSSAFNKFEGDKADAASDSFVRAEQLLWQGERQPQNDPIAKFEQAYELASKSKRVARRPELLLRFEFVLMRAYCMSLKFEKALGLAKILGSVDSNLLSDHFSLQDKIESRTVEAYCWQELGENKKAVEIIEQLMSEGPLLRANASSHCAEILLNQGRAEDISKLSLLCADADSLTRVARACRLKGRFDLAEECIELALNSAVKLTPSQKDRSKIEEARIYLCLGKPEKARQVVPNTLNEELTGEYSAELEEYVAIQTELANYKKAVLASSISARQSRKTKFLRLICLCKLGRKMQAKKLAAELVPLQSTEIKSLHDLGISLPI